MYMLFYIIAIGAFCWQTFAPWKSDYILAGGFACLLFSSYLFITKNFGISRGNY